MAYLIGVILAASLCGAARLAGFDRERVFYPTMLSVIASYYVLFAVMGGDHRALIVESAVACAFLALAIAGFRTSLWIVVAGIAAHGVFDFVHPRVFQNAGVPAWWPPFCLAFDLAAALWGAALLARRGGLAVRQPRRP